MQQEVTHLTSSVDHIIVLSSALMMNRKKEILSLLFLYKVVELEYWKTKKN